MERLPNLSETLRSVRLRTRTTGGRSSAWGCRVACGELPPPQLLKGVGFLGRTAVRPIGINFRTAPEKGTLDTL
jgi:hypothetical protein